MLFGDTFDNRFIPPTQPSPSSTPTTNNNNNGDEKTLNNNNNNNKSLDEEESSDDVFGAKRMVPKNCLCLTISLPPFALVSLNVELDMIVFEFFLRLIYLAQNTSINELSRSMQSWWEIYVLLHPAYEKNIKNNNRVKSKSSSLEDGVRLFTT